MKYKVKTIADRFVSILSKWPEVKCISLNEAADPDILDPYFAVIMDIYYTGTIPSPEKRKKLYGADMAVFETSGNNAKDRLLIGDLPVRLEFKNTKQIEKLVSIAGTRQQDLWLLKDSGTYGFYRLVHGEVFYSKTGWIKQIRNKLLNLNEEFWIQMRSVVQSKMEHSLSDLGAALINDDKFFYLISSAMFIKNACLALFCINRRFEPSHRAYHKQVLELPVLPDPFIAELETFIRENEVLTMERKYHIAKLLAEGIIALP